MPKYENDPPITITFHDGEKCYPMFVDGWNMVPIPRMRAAKSDLRRAWTCLKNASRALDDAFLSLFRHSEWRTIEVSGHFGDRDAESG